MAFQAITANVQGGSALERHLKEIEKSLGHGAHVRVGFLSSYTYPQGENGKTLHVAQAAFWNEYGTPAAKHPIPSRPFMRDMVEKRSPRWGVALGNALRKTGYDGEKALAIMGELLQGQMRRSINEWKHPANADATVARKGFNKPLTDTGEMFRSVDFQVMAGDGASDD